MKKIIKIIITIFILVFGYYIFVNREKDYEIKYMLDNYTIKEKYDKNKKYYSFNVSFDGYNYDFVFEHKYQNLKKIVKLVNHNYIDDYLCLGIKVFNKDSEVICSDKKNYYVKSSIDHEKVDKTVIRDIQDITVYNNDSNYFLWNGYGLYFVNKNKNYRIFKNEIYDNLLSYKYKKYILFANYDEKREFNNFYIFDMETHEIIKWELDNAIAFDSYFMGDYNDLIYLFDRKNKTQYSLNIEKKDIKVTNTSDAAFYYNYKETLIDLKKIQYEDIVFKKDNLYNFSLDNNKLYYNYYKSNKNIIITKRKVLSIVEVIGNKIFYLSDNNLYSFEIGKSEILLLNKFEWNFTYKNKIFVN